MATERQITRFYFPAWNECAKANEWKMVQGRLLRKNRPEVAKYLPEELLQKVWDTADHISTESVRATNLDDLRHACTVVALGKDKSCKDLTNAEIDRVVTLFRLLRDPSDLDAIENWDNPDLAERRRVIGSIKRLAPEMYILSVAKGKFSGQYEHPYWEELKTGQLKMLAMTLRERAKVHDLWAGKPEHQAKAHAEVPEDNIPY